MPDLVDPLTEVTVADELVQHPHFGDYKLRVTEPQLCDPSVKQYSGYLDITDDKHLFFWLVIPSFFSSVICKTFNLCLLLGSLSHATLLKMRPL
jgi:hypothetical protein